MKDKESKMSAEKIQSKREQEKEDCLPYDWFVL